VGSDTRLVEDLVGDPVTDARRECLIQQQGLHGRRALAQQLEESLQWWNIQERVEAQAADRRLSGGVAPEPDATQPARIAHRQLPAVVEAKQKLGETRWPRIFRLAQAARRELHPARTGSVQATAHPEMKTWPWALVELEPEVLAVSADADNTAAGESPFEAPGRHRLENDRVRRTPDADDPATGSNPLGQKPRGLDLRQLWHRPKI